MAERFFPEKDGKSPKKTGNIRNGDLHGLVAGVRKNKGLNDQSTVLLDDELQAPPYLSKNSEFSSGSRPDDFADIEEARFLRARNRVPVRRRLAQRSNFRRWVRLGIIALALAVLCGLGWEVRNFLRHDAHFLLTSTAAIQLQGNQIVTRPEVITAFTKDIGHSIFVIPLEARRAEIQTIPWVRSATVMRLWPNRLRVAIQERTPVAYMRDGNTIRMLDADGVLLDMPPGAMQHNSFPVVTGITANDPVSTRMAKMRLYQQFMAALDAGGGKFSQTVSEVNVSDPEDMRAMITDGSSEILVHFGDSDFLARYQSFATHRAEWLRQYPRLASVDMRYGRQVVLDMASGDAAGQSSTQNASGTSNSAGGAGTGKTMNPTRNTAKHTHATRGRKAGH
ncbi:MAG TPA: FtsQ-type POTRA domain-containing protein [Acidobacteriaceae bacterium]|jgi:cell division protein FtsQ|nr:FtsQ-type POTRA domain-containing protein [Acidobacteriaceae bacterium]